MKYVLIVFISFVLSMDIYCNHNEFLWLLMNNEDIVEEGLLMNGGPFDCESSTLSQLSCELVVSTFSLTQGGDLLCDLNTLDKYCATMPSGPLVNPAPSPLCDGTSEADNMSWFVFVAGLGEYAIEIVPENCVSAVGQSDIGIQVGIYTDCTFSESVICFDSCSLDSITMTSDVLIPGKSYYFWIDGCNGAICDYNINILGDFNVYVVPEPEVLICQNIDCNSVLIPGDEVIIETYDLDIDLIYFWTIPSGVEILNPDDPWDPQTTNENNINLKFPINGSFTICLDEVSNYCSSTLIPICIDIVVEGLTDEIFEDEYVCKNQLDTYVPVSIQDPNGDGTIGWQLPPPFSFLDGIPYTGQVTAADGQTYDQTITVHTIKLMPPERVDRANCLPFSILNPYGDNFAVDTNIENLVITFPDGSIDGCDTTIIYTAYILSIEGDISEVGLTGDNTMSLFFETEMISPLSTTGGLTVDYIWKDEEGNVIPDSDGNPKTTEAGNGLVTLIISMEIFDVVCEYEFIYEVVISGLSQIRTSEVVIYPNPINDVINIEFNSMTNFVKTNLYDINGKLVFSRSSTLMDETLSINVDEINVGLYILEIMVGDQPIYKKIVIE